MKGDINFLEDVIGNNRVQREDPALSAAFRGGKVDGRQRPLLEMAAPIITA